MKVSMKGDSFAAHSAASSFWRSICFGRRTLPKRIAITFHAEARHPKNSADPGVKHLLPREADRSEKDQLRKAVRTPARQNVLHAASPHRGAAQPSLLYRYLMQIRPLTH